MIHNNFSLLNVKTTVIDALLYFPAIAAFLLSGLIFIIKINGLFRVNLYMMLLPLLVNTKPRVSLWNLNLIEISFLSWSAFEMHSVLDARLNARSLCIQQYNYSSTKGCWANSIFIFIFFCRRRHENCRTLEWNFLRFFGYCTTLTLSTSTLHVVMCDEFFILFQFKFYAEKDEFFMI